MRFGMGFGELVLILVIVVVVFGATKLPGLEEGLGNGIKRFRENLQSAERPRLLLQRRKRYGWALSDWLWVAAAVALAGTVIAKAALHR